MNEVSLELADGNMQAIHADLFGGLRRVASRRQRTVDDIGLLMGITSTYAESLLAGHVDLTLSDLQELALAVGACLAFTVEMDDRYPESQPTDHSPRSADSLPG